MTLKAKPGVGRDVAQKFAAPVFHDPVAVGKKKGPAAAANTGDPWWMDALNALGSVGGLVTNQVEAWTDDRHDWRDYLGGLVEPIGKGVYNQVMKGDGSLGFEDIPILGTLTHINNASKKGSDILGNLGVQNQAGKTWGGLGVDIALDPLTWITFGSTAAVKAGGKAAGNTAKAIGKELNLGKVTYKNVAVKAADQAYEQTLRRTGDALQANRAQAETLAAVQQRVKDAGKAARSKAQNAAASFDIPFTKTTFQFGRKPAALRKSSPKLANHGANVLQRTLDRAGLTGNVGRDFVQKALGKTDFRDVTYQEFRWLQGETKRYGEYVAKHTPTAPWSASGEVLDGVGRIDPRSVPRAPEAFQPGKFVPDMGVDDISPFGAKMRDKFRALNPRAIGKADSGGLVNAQGNAIQDTYGSITGHQREFDRFSKEARSVMGDLTPTQQKVVEYMLEGEDLTRIPGVTQADMHKAAPAASYLRKQYQAIAEAEGGVGALDNIRQSYAPHVINRSPEQLESILQKYADDPELAKLSKISGKNGFNQERRSFDTLAQLDNYLAALGDDLAKATDPSEIAKLTEKLDEVSNLFERDPLKAFQKRLHKSYKVRELNKLYRKMEDDGILIRPDDAKGAVGADFVRLDAVEAGKLNVPVGTLMHKEVKEGLMKADELFSEQGLNKFLDNATAVTNIWKSVVTSYRPVHHVNNLIGNIFNNSLAGVGPTAYSKSVATLNRMFKNKPKQEDLNLMKEAMKSGIFGQNHSDEFRRVFGDVPANKIRKIEQAVTGNKYINFMRRWMGDSTDNWSRLAHFIAIKEKTGSAELAAQSVRKYLFNYREQTKADRAIRLVVPFWNWTKRNIPLQIEQMARQPRFAQTYARLQDASYDMYGEDRQDQADFISESYFRLPGEKLYNSRAPITDLNNLGDPLDMAKFAVTSSTPWVKIPFELTANKNMFTGRAIDPERDRNGGYSAEALGKYGVGQSGILNDIYRLSQGEMHPLDAVFGRVLDVRRE